MLDFQSKACIYMVLYRIMSNYPLEILGFVKNTDQYSFFKISVSNLPSAKCCLRSSPNRIAVNSYSLIV